jgi:hypothetical protein
MEEAAAGLQGGPEMRDIFFSAMFFTLDKRGEKGRL